MLLLHGTGDNSVPCEIAVEFSTLLKARKWFSLLCRAQPLFKEAQSA